MDKKLVRDIIQWDVRTWSRALQLWEESLGPGPINGCGLELGAREGGLSLWLAIKGMDVVCTDIRNTEANARALHKEYDVCSRIQYLDIDAAEIPFENHFDIVVFKSVLGAVGCRGQDEKQQRAMDAIFKALKPGGKLLFAENLTATPVHTWLRRHVVRGYARVWRYVTPSEMRDFLKPFSSYETHTSGFAALFGGMESLRNVLALVDQNVFDRITPESWRCLIYGIATK
jgi:SAM-dependent methyltransferase